MPNIKSAKKRVITSEAARQRNRVVKTNLTSTRREFMEVVATGDKEKSTEAYVAYCSTLDKAVKKGVLKKNSGNRSKARAHARIIAL